MVTFKKVCSSLNHHFDGVGHTYTTPEHGWWTVGEFRGTTVRWHGFRSEVDAQRKQLQPLLCLYWRGFLAGVTMVASRKVPVKS